MPDRAFSNLDFTEKTLRGDLVGVGVKMHPVTANIHPGVYKSVLNIKKS